MTSRRQLILAYLTAPDEAGRRRCTLCPQQFSSNSESSVWFKHLERQHHCEWEEIEAQSKRKESVASPASEATSSVVSRPSKKMKGEGSTSSQSSLPALFAASSSKRALSSLAMLFAQSSIPHLVLQTPEFKQFMLDMGWKAALPTRESLRMQILSQAATLREELVQRVRHTPVTVAVDSWTNVSHEKVTNVVLLAKGVAFYWCSIVNSNEKNDAAWVSRQLAAVFRTLIHEHHIRIAALVVDNEAVNKATFNRLAPEFPFLVHVPCAAHTVQLAVRSCLATPPFSATVTQLLALIHFFDTKENRHELMRVQSFRGSPQLFVLKPNDTRWSSMHIAAERIQKMRRDIEGCNIHTISQIRSKDAFFEAVDQLCDFLKPFRSATDAIQSDKATLLTVYEQFTTLLQHTHAMHKPSASCVLQRWNEHINVAATVAVAWASFASIPPSLNAQSACDFIADFGTEYLTFYELGDAAKQTPQQIRDDLTRQFAEVNMRTDRYADLERRKLSLERTGWSARLLWSFYSSRSLAIVVDVLLSLSASEAAVERTFSAQAAVHSKRRNRLSSPTVEAEMFLKFNNRTMQTEAEASGVVEMNEEYDVDDCADTVIELDNAPAPDLFAPVVLEKQTAPCEEEQDDAIEENAVVPMEESDDVEAAAAAAASANSRRARREPSVVFNSCAAFVEWFIKELHITSSTKWNGDLRIALERYATSRFPPPCPNTQKLEDLVRAAL